MHKTRAKSFWRIISLASTPWILFISSSLGLFLINQDNLDYNLAALNPFIYLTIISFLIGLGIATAALIRQQLLWLSWVFYLAGPAFLLWNTVDSPLENTLGELVGPSIFLLFFFMVCIALRKIETTKAIPFFCVFATLIISADIITFVNQFERPSQSSRLTVESAFPSQEDASKEGNVIPNIYHVLLDGYQSDIFELTLDEELRTGLGGFTFFRNNITNYGRTRVSIPAVFNSQLWIPETPLKEFTWHAFNDPSSLLGILYDQGYETTAFLHKRFEFSPNNFKKVRFHHEFNTDRAWSNKAFLKVWVYNYLPKIVATHLIGTSFMERIEAKRVSPDNFSVTSLDVFNYFLANEQHQAANGRYTFLHLILPHPPFRLDEHCEVKRNQGALAQFKCASKLMTQLVQELQRLDRFDDSLIIFHGDHGLNFNIQGNELYESIEDRTSSEFHLPRSKALLLYKEFGKSPEFELEMNSARTTLLDITPSVVGSFGQYDLAPYQGIHLMSVRPREKQQFYFYHLSSNEKEVFRYRLEKDTMSFDHVLEFD